jgi:hypothetical protein
MSKLNSLDRLIWKTMQNVHYDSHIFNNYSIASETNRHELYEEYLSAYKLVDRKQYKYPKSDLITFPKFYQVLAEAVELGFVFIDDGIVEFKHN